jgi:hypothetical protein
MALTEHKRHLPNTDGTYRKQTGPLKHERYFPNTKGTSEKQTAPPEHKRHLPNTNYRHSDTKTECGPWSLLPKWRFSLVGQTFFCLTIHWLAVVMQSDTENTTLRAISTEHDSWNYKPLIINNHTVHGVESFLGRQRVPHTPKKFAYILEPEVSVPYSQRPTNCPLLREIHFLYNFPLFSFKILFIMTYHLCLGFPSVPCPTYFPTKNLHTFNFSHIHATLPANPILLDLITRIIQTGEQY